MQNSIVFRNNRESDAIKLQKSGSALMLYYYSGSIYPSSSFALGSGGGGGTGAGFPYSGSAVITGSLTVTNTVSAPSGSFNNLTVITLISSSVITQQLTGSTKFGSLPTDTHQFTGSVLFSGSLTLSTININPSTVLDFNFGGGENIIMENDGGSPNLGIGSFGGTPNNILLQSNQLSFNRPGGGQTVLQASSNAGTHLFYFPSSSGYSKYIPISVNNVSASADGNISLNIGGSSISTTGSTLYSTNPAAGPEFSNDNSIFLGTGSGYQATNAADSNFLGYYAGYQATNANNSNFLGYQAGYQATRAANSVFIGYQAGFGNNYNGAYSSKPGSWNGSYTTAIGYQAGYSASEAINSNFLGYRAGYQATNAYESNFLGFYAGGFATIANNSNFLGRYAGLYATSASNSTLIGYQVGYNAGGGILGISSNNIIIGTNITLPNRTQDSINLGAIIFATGSYSTTTGNPFSGSMSNGRVGINKVSPTQALDVSGSVQISDVLVLPYQNPLPSSKPTGSIALSGSGATFVGMFMYNGTSWVKLSV
jgi:hypothetical protein